MVAYKWTLFTN